MHFVLRLSRCWTVFLSVMLALVAGSVAAAAADGAGERVALVIGNSAYRSVPSLKNAAGDAAEIARTLTSLGFKVIEREDADRTTFRAALDAFYQASQTADAAVVFYSGHGFQLNNVNYLVPVDAELRDRGRIAEETIRLDEIAVRAHASRRQTLIFLDACRNNPLPSSVQPGTVAQGLAQLETGSGTFIAFATQPGNVSRDGSGAHSPFATALLEHMPTPGISISDMMIRVRNSVEQATLHTQTPWDQSSLRSQFYFNPALETESGELTEEDREMLLSLDPDMRARFEKRFGIRLGSDSESAAAEPRMEVAAVQPRMRIEAADAGEAADADAPQSSTTQSSTAQPSAAPPPRPRLTILAGEDDQPPVGPAAVAEGGTLAVEIGKVTPIEPPILKGSGSLAVAALSARDAARAAPAFTAPSASARNAYDPATAATAAVVASPARSPDEEGRAAPAPAETRPAQAPASQRPDRASTPSSMAALAKAVTDSSRAAGAVSEGRSATLSQSGSQNLIPIAEDHRRIVGEEVLPAAPEVAAEVAVARPAEPPKAAEPAPVEVAALDPKAMSRLSPDGPAAADALDPATPDETPADLPRSIQQELARLGCYRAAVDGEWGQGSTRALLRYYATKKMDPDVLDPTADLLGMLRDEDEVVCKRTEPPTPRVPQKIVKLPNATAPAPAQAARPQAPKPPSRTIATRPATKPAVVKREAATEAPAGAPSKSLKKTLTMGAFR